MNKLSNLNVAVIVSKSPKSIAVRTKCPRGLRVWDLCHRYCLATTTFFLDIYVVRLKLHCYGLITIMLSVTVFINYFILTFRREKKFGSNNNNPNYAQSKSVTTLI